MATTWPAFDPQRRERIAETLRRMLRTGKRDEAEAEGIIARLEQCVRFYGIPPGPELPPSVGHAAHVLLGELRAALTDCDARTQRQRMELLRGAISGRYEMAQDIHREDASLEWRRVWRSEWIGALERLAEPPRSRGQPALGERDEDFRRSVAGVLQEAGLPCEGRGISDTAMVFAEVLAFGSQYGLKQGPSTLAEGTQRKARSDAFKRALGKKDQDPVVEQRRAQETELLRQSWPAEAAERTAPAKRSK